MEAYGKLKSRGPNAAGFPCGVLPLESCRPRKKMAPPPHATGARGGAMGDLVPIFRRLLVQSITANVPKGAAAAHYRAYCTTTAVPATGALSRTPVSFPTTKIGNDLVALSRLVNQPVTDLRRSLPSADEVPDGSNGVNVATTDPPAAAETGPRRRAKSKPIRIPGASARPRRIPSRLNDEEVWWYNPHACRSEPPPEIAGIPLMFKMDDL